MTSFNGSAETNEDKAVVAPPPGAEQPGQVAVLPEEPPKILEPRLKATPQQWDEALRFSQMLAYCRPHQSRTESRFINEYIRPVGIKFDKYGNIYKRIGDAPVMWSCHVDTVHTKPGIQKIEYWVDKTTNDTFLGVAAGEKSSCLGADDTTGVWLMLEMIRNKVPGLYVFHRGEEVGGLGSKWIVKNNPKLVDGIRFAIAFDRKDTDSIITFQRSTRCCSDEFAKSLAAELNMGHRCDEGGSFTDTASYVDLIAECTNVSVGYYNAHCPTEKTNIDYLFKLRDALLKVDIAKLVEKRKPGENTSRWPSYKSYSYSSDYRNYDLWRDYYDKDRPAGGLEYDELEAKFKNKSWRGEYYYDHRSGFWLPTNKGKKDLGVTKLAPSANEPKPDIGYSSYTEAVRLIKNNPEIIADLLEFQGYSSLDLKEYIHTYGGHV